MFNIAIDDPDYPCPECQRILVELAKFRHSMYEDGTMGSEFSPFVRMGWRVAPNPLAIIEMVNGAWDMLLIRQRNKRVEKLCAEVLPHYPKTLICPHCLYLWRR